MNIWLDDRNGVRTPMQWSAEKNAGFSSDDSSQLYAPLVNDPIFGFTRVNVAAQCTDPNSLWNTIKRMVAIRKKYSAFGRGDCVFLEPENAAILAYTRRCDDQTLLIVNNLSSQSQQVLLDLGKYAERSIVDIWNSASFAPTIQEPLDFHLDPYQYLWLAIRDAGT